jgi:hypothetical protein
MKILILFIALLISCSLNAQIFTSKICDKYTLRSDYVSIFNLESKNLLKYDFKDSVISNDTIVITEETKSINFKTKLINLIGTNLTKIDKNTWTFLIETDKYKIAIGKYSILLYQDDLLNLREFKTLLKFRL